MEEDELKALIADTLDAILPENPDQTTRWAWDFESAAELEDWLRQHRCNDASIRRALEEYDVWREKGTPKKFEVRGNRARTTFLWTMAVLSK
jgi:hypothetical protein